MDSTPLTVPHRYLPRTRPSLKHVPNALTVARILVTPVFGIVLLRAGDGQDWGAGILFGVAAATDQVDGWLARRWRAESRFGALADPLADKLIIGTAVVVLVHAHRIPVWVFVLLLARQAALWGARMYARGRYGFPVSRMAKVSAWVLYAALGMIMITDPATWWPQWFLWAGIALALAEVWPYAEVIREHGNAPTSQPGTGSRILTEEPPHQAGAPGRHRPIPTLYRLPWLLLGFAPWYLKHFVAQPYRRLPWRSSLRQLLTDPKRRHRIALYDGVINIILNGYATLCGRAVNRTAGRIVVAFTRLAFAFDDEHERRCARGDSLAFDAVFGGDQVQQRLREWREFMRPHPAYPAIRAYLEGFVRSLYADYTKGTDSASAPDGFEQLVRAATLDSGGFLTAIVQTVALSQGATLAEQVYGQFAALGVLGKSADDMIDFGADGAAERPNLLSTLVAQTPPEQTVVRDARSTGARMNTVWWRRHCPATFARYAAMCAVRYAVLDTAWLRFASHLMWVPALLGRATTKDVRGRL